MRGVVTDKWIIDDGDPQFTTVVVWTVPSTVSGYLQDDRLTPGDGSGETLRLGEFISPTIWLDDNAVGYGWQLVPNRDNFSPWIDLLSVIAHELGHVLGHADLDSKDDLADLIAKIYFPGERRLTNPLLDTRTQRGESELSPSGIRKGPLATSLWIPVQATNAATVSTGSPNWDQAELQEPDFGRSRAASRSLASSRSLTAREACFAAWDRASIRHPARTSDHETRESELDAFFQWLGEQPIDASRKAIIELK